MHCYVPGEYAENKSYCINLPPGNWQILCTLKECAEIDAEKIVETIHVEYPPGPGNDFQGDWSINYADYENPGEFAGWGGDAGSFNKAIDSLRSLIRVKGLDTEKNYIILEKK